jgi:hypothetical protein
MGMLMRCCECGQANCPNSFAVPATAVTGMVWGQQQGCMIAVAGLCGCVFTVVLLSDCVFYI